MRSAEPLRLVLLAAIGALALCAMWAPGLFEESAASPPGLVEVGILAAGFAIGCYGTVVGIGGGPLIVPVLHFVFGWSTEDVVASSLFVVLLNALSGSAAYARQKRIDIEGGVAFSVAAMPGAVVSGFFHHLVHVPSFDVIFGMFLLALAGYTVARVDGLDRPAVVTRLQRKRWRHVVMIDAFRNKYDFYTNQNLGIAINIVLGFVAGFLGIGGGVLQVPVLVFLLGYPIHIATATSHFVTMLTSAFAVAPNVVLGNVHFGAVLWLGAGVLVGAQAGAKLALRLKTKAILYLFAIILVAFALRLFLY